MPSMALADICASSRASQTQWGPEVGTGLMQRPATQEHLEEHTWEGLRLASFIEDAMRLLKSQWVGTCLTHGSHLPPQGCFPPCLPDCMLCVCPGDRGAKGPVSLAVENSHLPSSRCWAWVSPCDSSEEDAAALRWLASGFMCLWGGLPSMGCRFSSQASPAFLRLP